MEKNVMGAKIKLFEFLFFFFFSQKASQWFRNSAYQTRIRFSKFSLNFFCKIDLFKLCIAWIILLNLTLFNAWLYEHTFVTEL